MGGLRSIASKIGRSAQTSPRRVRQYDRDTGQRDGQRSADAARLMELERENRGLKRPARSEVVQRLFAQAGSIAASSREGLRAPRTGRGRADLQSTAGLRRPVSTA